MSQKSGQSNQKEQKQNIDSTQDKYNLGDVLPENFAETLMTLEMDLQSKDFNSIDTVQKLLQLYSIGVGYYEQIGDQQYEYFQKKIKQLFCRPQVVSTMTNEVNRVRERENQIVSEELKLQQKKELEQFLQKEEISRQKEDYVNKMNFILHEKQMFVHRYLNQYYAVCTKNDQLIRNELEKQRDMILHRVKKRRRVQEPEMIELFYNTIDKQQDYHQKSQQLTVEEIEQQIQLAQISLSAMQQQNSQADTDNS